ncbi:hypothetical protein SSTU70S_04716 [Stutzerimonas stutzeri]
MRILLIVLLMTLTTPLVQARTLLNQTLTLDTGHGVLQGSLVLPKSVQPVPVALLIAGSGPTDRDGNNPAGRNDSLKRLAQGLAKQGVASLRYDKRGVGASLSAAPQERDLSVDAYVRDVLAWSARLREDPRLGKLILIGHSEGALIASLALAVRRRGIDRASPAVAAPSATCCVNSSRAPATGIAGHQSFPHR